MNVEIITKIDFDSYDTFTKNNNATFYHSIKHLQFLGKILGIIPSFITVKEKDSLIGIMPFFVKKSKYGLVINSLPFFGSYGGFVANNHESKIKILEMMNTFNQENDVLSSVIIADPFSKNFPIYEKYYKFIVKEPRMIQCLQINSSTENIWLKFEQRVRRAVRKALTHNITVTKLETNPTDLGKFYSMHKMDMTSKGGKVKPIEFFQNLKTFFRLGEDYDIFIAMKDGRDIAYLLVFYFNFYVEYYMPAYDSKLKNLQGTSILIWESIKESIKKNMKIYNFGGTWKNQPELYLFKRGWAATDLPYCYYIHGDIAQTRKIGVEEIKKSYEYFYVFPYDMTKQ